MTKIFHTKSLNKRLRREIYFKRFCLSTIIFALCFLLFFAVDITKRALPAFHQHYAHFDVTLDPNMLDPLGDKSPESLQEGNYNALVKQTLRDAFPEITSRGDKRKLYKIISINSPYLLADYVQKYPDKLGETINFAFPLDDEFDLALKYDLDVQGKDGISRNVSEQQIIWLQKLRDNGQIENRLNFAFLSNNDSRESETAGILGALIGSFWLLMITLILSVPLGVLAAIYLSEFAPENKFTDFIEVNINNLAAVPSIVFGLLGLAIFLNFFGLPRSTPFVGGLVLSLMSMPTIIIVTRTALKSVPQSIREAALGLGASRMQMIFHHVLPVCFPSILTGSIIAMAQALGETAPLLMIGMVAFIINTPSNPLEYASALPVQIFIWADTPELGFVARSAAAILVLLVFLITFNLLAIILRQKLSRKL